MDRKSKALDKFRKPYSCAQTVYAAYASDSPDDLAEMAANRGGLPTTCAGHCTPR